MIAIIGAGISGLALAAALRMRGVAAVVFQKDSSFHCRKQGYGLTILQAKKALKRLMVLEKATAASSLHRSHLVLDAQGKLRGFYGTAFWDELTNYRSLRNHEKGLSLHLPRQTLRSILLEKATQVAVDVKWGMALRQISFKPENVMLQFANNDSFNASLVVGCDGIRSQVRRLSVVGQDPLNYLGVQVTLGLCNSAHPLTQEKVFQTAGGKHRLFSMPFSKAGLSTMWQHSCPASQDEALHYARSPELLRLKLESWLGSWHDPVPAFLRQTSAQNIMTLPVYDREPDLPLLKDERVVLLGDALHPMSPFKGQGANQALLDAVLLADLIPDGSISSFHGQSLARARDKVLSSRRRAQSYHDGSHLSRERWLYPGISSQLLAQLQRRGVGHDSEMIEQRIIQVMRSEGLLPPE